LVFAVPGLGLGAAGDMALVSISGFGGGSVLAVIDLTLA
jgi:hypothetical protein